MNHWLDELDAELAKRHDAGLLRQLHPVCDAALIVHIDNQPVINLASNDYLGFSRHPVLKQAAMDAIREHGTGSGASKLVSGHSLDCQRFERDFATFKGAQAGLLLSSGYLANLAAVTGLVRKQDVIFIDKLTHASLIDAARASGATLRVFPHRNLDKLSKLLERYPHAPHRFILTDSVFSMEGDVADLPALCNLAQQYQAILIVDEAHGTGVLGQHGAGLCQLQNVMGKVDIVISTGGKAMGAAGGIITASHEVIQTLVNHARPLIYTTAPPPAQVASLHAALKLIQAQSEQRCRLASLSQRVRQEASDMGFEVPATAVATPIIPLVVQTPKRAVQLQAFLLQAGFFAPAIRPPTVAPNHCLVRLSLRADLEDFHIARLLNALQQWRG